MPRVGEKVKKHNVIVAGGRYYKVVERLLSWSIIELRP
jgi:hypothetical protein